MRQSVEINLAKPLYVKTVDNKIYFSAEPREGYELHPFYKMYIKDIIDVIGEDTSLVDKTKNITPCLRV